MNAGRFRLREATPADVSAIADLHVRTFVETHGPGPGLALRQQQWEAAFSRPDGSWFCVVLEDPQGNLIGFARGQPYDELEQGEFKGELNKIYLLREYHRRGLGRRLLCASAQRFLERGIRSMLLFGDARSPSNGFYEAMGGDKLFAKSGEFHGSYGWRDLGVLLGICRESSAVAGAPLALTRENSQRIKDSRVIHRRGLTGTILLALALGGCASNGGDDKEASVEDLEPPNRLVAVVRTNSLQWEGEQTYIPLYADGTASGLVVVNLDGGLLYGTGIPDSWTWLDEDTVEICTSVNILRNEVDFPPMERDCAPHPISGKELDLDGDGNIELIETFTILDPLFHRDRPRD